MSRVYRIEQTVVHVLTVKADSENQAEWYADQMGDDDFADKEWGDTNIILLPKKVTEADEDITGTDEEG